MAGFNHWWSSVWPGRSFSAVLTNPWRQGPAQASAGRVEHSWVLRLWVQILVSVGIVATDVAAGSSNSLWAIPLSFAGAGWSWRSRRGPNRVAKIFIAVGMLVVLSLFLGRIVGQANDTRLVLAELLIQLQVLHTFDLPRRKDLGYSATIGLILMAVAATISETSLFGLFLLLFLAVGLPVLRLDYRSRLRLADPGMEVKGQQLRHLGLMFVGVALLGLMVFALMPRMPGYQLRTFPVSAPIDVQGEFNNQTIINPGYVRSGQRPGEENSQATDGATFSSSTASLPFNSTFYSGFNQEMDQTLRGTLEPQEVMRVRTQSPGFWRVMAFDRYTGKGWTISENDQTQTLRRSRWSYRFSIPQTTSLARTKEVVQTFSILDTFPNLIPALSSPRHVYFPTQEIALDQEQGLRSPVALEEGLTYTIVSDVPYRDRTQMRQAGENYPKAIRQKYLQVPEAIAPILQDQAKGFLARSDYQPSAPSEKALLLAQAMKQNFTLKPDLPALPAEKDLVQAFIEDYGGGYPDHFSTTLTLMLRSVGIPARLATGFAPGQFNPFTGLYLVKNTDAYALTEVYIPKQGWFAFDPIPGHPVVPPSIEDQERFPLLSQLWHWVAGWFPSPVKNILSQLWMWLGAALGSLTRLMSQGWVGLGIGLLGGGSMALALWGLGRLRSYWIYRAWRRQLEPMERVYQDLLQWLAQQGHPKDPAWTVLEFRGQLLETDLPLEVAEILQAYAGWRYGQVIQNLDYLQQRLRYLQKLKAKPTAVKDQVRV
ncbi:transglutaminase TgpA family protein [Lyngbya confervoides]|uniref:DUF3488 and DUF4129 domain-containing transglutaminase family protein n=1 Tax=Lyngbya confervoides BDU141951 TaxID=1574623 RepID=A0ABD4T491_9CYAN|nr:DUF3488 and DUF4129 domain-containing transglutaminase family protein [Lyngbya confervoides]MCM1983491.1 DUF3488 and DUF4129 domain-containing transglutaminase family protein [Lyngbya confervoides BDU141951]